ncbi:Na+-transporting malonate decarboxylase, carboxybiotin decarboxylase subunit, madB [Enterococcus sp. JM4C]|uniref:Na+-transporting malonate decarboxylase, carboxybiotin decarboxylase subunit, madB n=1 Tax=Candidatus Enterococcus huntleyi TaxID=1857217 RepID=UPI0013797854|nr:Na+-transporting malonate decarboxylase, carboxybiotin decarboxylase subunit, madB [Enterococcus sp. JM4C]KAF1295839.1 Na+-transporting malonate decarboxylase, carboxybiotin decarboxylase subunit, madB [Enterococcus sp. JM4C]
MATTFVILHIVFGLISFAGSLLLAIGFRGEFQKLTTIQKSGIMLTIISLFATIVVTMASKGSLLSAGLFLLIGLLTCVFLMGKKSKA